MFRRAKRRRILTVFVAVWMNAQLLPVTLCRLLQPAQASAVESHEHDHRSEAEHSHSTIAAQADSEAPAHGAGTNCCDDPLNTCCIDSLRTTLLVSRDGMGVDADFLAGEVSFSPIVIVPVVLVLKSIPARSLGPPPHVPTTTILQV